MHENNSFGDLATELSPALARYLRRQVRDEALVEDLLQETLLRIAGGLSGFDGRSSLKTWAFAIAARVAIDHFRRRGVLPSASELSDVADVPDGARSPDEILAVEQMNDCVRNIIASLPDTYREAILLHHFNDLSAHEAAEVCGCTESNAKVRIHRGRTALKKALEEACELYRDADDVLRCVPKGTGK